MNTRLSPINITMLYQPASPIHIMPSWRGGGEGRIQSDHTCPLSAKYGLSREEGVGQSDQIPSAPRQHHRTRIGCTLPLPLHP